MMIGLIAGSIMCPLGSLAAKTGVLRCSEGEDVLHLRKAMAAGAVGLVLSAFTLSASTNLNALESTVLPVLFVLLWIGAFVDRATGWAPEGLSICLPILALALGASNGNWEITIGWAVLYGSLLWAAVYFAWSLGSQRVSSLPPPADIIAFMLPFLAFGVSMHFTVAMLLISTILWFCLFFPEVHRIFSQQEVEMKALADFDDAVANSDRPTITFLAIAYPVFSLVAMSSVVFRG